MRSREASRPLIPAVSVSSGGNRAVRDASSSSVSSSRSHNGISSPRSYNGSSAGGSAVFYPTNRYSASANLGPYTASAVHHESSSSYFPPQSQQHMHYHHVSPNSAQIRERYLTYGTGMQSQNIHQRPPPVPFPNQHSNNVSNTRSNNSKGYRYSGGGKQRRKHGRRDNSQNRGGSSSR